MTVVIWPIFKVWILVSLVMALDDLRNFVSGPHSIQQNDCLYIINLGNFFEVYISSYPASAFTVFNIPIKDLSNQSCEWFQVKSVREKFEALIWRISARYY